MKRCRPFSPQRQKTEDAQVSPQAVRPSPFPFPVASFLRTMLFFPFFLNRKLTHILNSWSWLFVGGLMSSLLVYLAFSSAVNINPRFIFWETGCNPK